MQNSNYTPISCSFYDELEALATLKKIAKIKYQDEAGKEFNVEAKIKDFKIKDKIEFMLLDNGQSIRLDYLKAVNGKVLNQYC